MKIVNKTTDVRFTVPMIQVARADENFIILFTSKMCENEFGIDPKAWVIYDDKEFKELIEENLFW